MPSISSLAVAADNASRCAVSRASSELACASRSNACRSSARIGRTASPSRLRPIVIGTIAQQAVVADIVRTSSSASSVRPVAERVASKFDSVPSDRFTGGGMLIRVGDVRQRLVLALEPVDLRVKRFPAGAFHRAVLRRAMRQSKRRLAVAAGAHLRLLNRGVENLPGSRACRSAASRVPAPPPALRAPTPPGSHGIAVCAVSLRCRCRDGGIAGQRRTPRRGRGIDVESAAALRGKPRLDVLTRLIPDRSTELEPSRPGAVGAPVRQCPLGQAQALGRLGGGPQPWLDVGWRRSAFSGICKSRLWPWLLACRR